MKIENARYKVEVVEKAAEITSFYDKQTNIEYIWSGNPEHWAGRNPILFPVIGSSYNKKYHFNGIETTMGNHGILRSAVFTFVEQTDNSISLSYKSNEETLKQYPFEFIFTVTYTLVEDTLIVAYEIQNQSNQKMPFNFGLHPAFNCPLTSDLSFTDYRIEFEPKLILNGAGPHQKNEYTNGFPLRYSDFNQYPTFIYNDVIAPYVAYTDGKHGVKVSTVGYPVLAIWTKENAPFICLEPWLAANKRIEEDMPFEDRDASRCIESNHRYLTSYTITVF